MSYVSGSDTVQTTTGTTANLPSMDATVLAARTALMGMLGTSIQNMVDLAPAMKTLGQTASKTVSDYFAGKDIVPEGQRALLSDIAAKTREVGEIDINEQVLQGQRAADRNLAGRNLGTGGSVGAYLEGEIQRAAINAKKQLSLSTAASEQEGQLQLTQSTLDQAIKSIGGVSSQSTEAAKTLAGLISAAPSGTTTSQTGSQTASSGPQFGLSLGSAAAAAYLLKGFFG